MNRVRLELPPDPDLDRPAGLDRRAEGPLTITGWDRETGERIEGPVEKIELALGFADVGASTLTTMKEVDKRRGGRGRRGEDRGEREFIRKRGGSVRRRRIGRKIGCKGRPDRVREGAMPQAARPG